MGGEGRRSSGIGRRGGGKWHSIWTAGVPKLDANTGEGEESKSRIPQADLGATLHIIAQMFCFYKRNKGREEYFKNTNGNGNKRMNNGYQGERLI